METRDENGRFTKGNTIGRATRFFEGNDLSQKYDERFCEKIIEYFLQGAEAEPEVIYEERYKDGEIVSKIPKMVMPPKYRTFEKFAVSIGVCKNTLYEWAKSHPRFGLAMKIAKNLQLSMLKENATAKHYDSNFAKFLCVNDHDMSDKVQVAGTDEKGKEAPFSVSINIID